jgi:flagellar hook-associated protein 3 FlgL
MQVSLAGDAVFGPAIAALQQLQTDLNNNTVQPSTIQQISNSLQALTQAQATVGARENRLSAATSSQQDLITSNQSMLSQLEDVNMPSAITELTARQTTYQASLAITAKVMQSNLIDYLR